MVCNAMLRLISVWNTPFSMEQTHGVKSKVILSLKEVENITQLSLVYSGLPRGAHHFDTILELDAGWDPHLTALRERIAEHAQ